MANQAGKSYALNALTPMHPEAAPLLTASSEVRADGSTLSATLRFSWASRAV